MNRNLPGNYLLEWIWNSRRKVTEERHVPPPLRTRRVAVLTVRITSLRSCRSTRTEAPGNLQPPAVDVQGKDLAEHGHFERLVHHQPYDILSYSHRGISQVNIRSLNREEHNQNWFGHSAHDKINPVGQPLFIT